MAKKPKTWKKPTRKEPAGKPAGKELSDKELDAAAGGLAGDRFVAAKEQTGNLGKPGPANLNAGSNTRND